MNALVNARNGDFVYPVVLADPPWAPKDSLPGPSRGAARHYPVIATSDLCRLEIPKLAPNAVLFLWRLASMPVDALEVARAWGFVPKTEIVWVKTTKNGKLHFGMGRQVRASHETCIVATRGKMRPLSRSVRSVFFAPVGAHSVKPDAFYQIIESMYGGPYVELFARRVRTGWDSVGLDLGSGLSVKEDRT